MNEEHQNLDATKELPELSDLNNQIFEINNTSVNDEEIKENTEENTFFTPPAKLTIKKRIKQWWGNRKKGQKIAIVSGSVIVVILIVIVVFFLIRTSKKEEEILPPVDVIVQEENYRYENGILVFLNNTKEEIGRYTCENQSEELCFVSYYSTEDDFDVEKKVYENNTPIVTRSAIMEDTYAFVNDNPRKEDEKIKLYNIKTGETKGTYRTIKKADKNRFILKNEENLYGVIEIDNGEILTKLDFTYNYLGFIPNETNAYISTLNDRNFIIDENGRNLSKAITGTIKNLNEHYIKVKLDDGKYEVYNYNNQNVFKESFDYIELFEDYAALIYDKNLYLRFYDQNKLNEEAIHLESKEYIKTSVYNTDNTLKETKESFSIEEAGDIITIHIKNNNNESTTQIVNKAEGNVNKSLRNMNYFDGKLYIYSDTNKTKLLGIYTCSNKNNVSKKDKTLKNCTLATDTVFEDNDYEVPGSVGAIPIFNERFIFISDNPDLVNDTNKTVVLYDLKKNTSLGKYREVNTYSYTGTDDITFSTVTDLQVVAKNQNGNFGVIKINLTEIKGFINFNYSSMERLRDYYVAGVPNGYLLVSRKNASESSSVIRYKIRNYNDDYVKVKMDNGNYSIYKILDIQEKSVNETGFQYIELYDKFFAGVNSENKLGIYTYENPKHNIISGETLIPLNLTNYYGNGTLAFKIEGTKIQVGNFSKSYDLAEQEIVLPTLEQE